MHRRVVSFTNRQIGKRESLYNPETLPLNDWPDPDPHHDASWDWLIAIVVAFGLVIIGIGTILTLFVFGVIW